MICTTISEGIDVLCCTIFGYFLSGQTGRITTTNRTEIPYCEAILYEVLRLRPPAPLGIPRATTCDTSVGKYFTLKSHYEVLSVKVNLAKIPNE